jgi:alkylation response protein AidB-like acyl-CoA dehydrogenase
MLVKGAGISFDLSEDHLMIQDMVRKFAEKEVSPGAGERDRSMEFPRDICSKLGELGLMGVNTPTEYGGAGMDSISYAIIIEELSRACASTGVVAAVQNTLAQLPLYRFGTEELKRKYLPDLAAGKKIGAYCLTEPSSGSDAGSLQTMAQKNGDFYFLNGQKLFVTNGMAADFFIVYATIDKSKGNKGISAFVVERTFPGFKIVRKEEMLGVRASGTAQIAFENCRVPVSNLIGEEGDGFKIALTTLDSGRISIASQAVGIAQGAYDAALKYSKERSQFGKTISNFQFVQEMLVDMITYIEAARLLVYRSSYLKDKGVPFSKEASMAKYFASTMSEKATSHALQIHGGYGYTKDYPVERFYRDARVTEIYEGTTEVQKMVIARNILGG